jgi:hypothetical protein
MEARHDVTATGAGLDANGWADRVYAACLVLFPLLFLIFAGTDIHPDPSGETAADQVRAVAESAGAWQVVHLVLAGASLLGIGAVLGLRSLVPSRTSRLLVAASIAAALGVAAAGLVAGIVVMEAALVAPVAKACAAASGSCLSPDNEAFLREFAGASWNDLAHLSYAAGTLIFSLGTLAVLGWAAKTVRRWEALVMVVGIVGIYATNTVLHGDAKYGLTFVLVASASIAYRMQRRSHHE